MTTSITLHKNNLQISTTLTLLYHVGSNMTSINTRLPDGCCTGFLKCVDGGSRSSTPLVMSTLLMKCDNYQVNCFLVNICIYSRGNLRLFDLMI